MTSYFCTASAFGISIDTVPVGNVGNANNRVPGNSFYGGVDYAYRIGVGEVTVGQYTAFLNAVAATDTYGLYNSSMATDLNIAGIARDGASGSYGYSVIGSPRKPVTYVSWGDAARFANWLHNGQPSGLQDATTTERGAYTLDGAITSPALNLVARNAHARWFIPTENEWYKAAYHQPGGGFNSYWFYPMRNNTMPYSDQPPGSDAPIQSQTANFYHNNVTHINYNDGWAVTATTTYDPSQNYLTDAGAYTESTSFYGTFDQGGNVWEWNEAVVGSRRGLRGGSGDWGANTMHAWYRNTDNFQSGIEFVSVGFRVATLPEPNTLILVAIAGVNLLRRRRSRRLPRSVY
jgi:formylglycine-generating enzyme required for sulfatase activity